VCFIIEQVVSNQFIIEDTKVKHYNY
jgi:hypothetical protein